MEKLPIIKTEKKIRSVVFYIFGLFLVGGLFAAGAFFSFQETMVFQTCFLGLLSLASFVTLFPLIFMIANEVSVYDDFVEIKTFYGKSKKKIFIKDITKIKAKPKQYETVFYLAKGKFTIYHMFNDMNCFEVVDTIIRLMKKNKKTTC
jgi:hypothetical protein